MTRFMERLGRRAPSEQTFGVMAATLLAVRGDDAPFESGRAYELFLHVKCFWRKGAPARPKPTQWVQRLPEDLHAFQRDYGATFTDVFDKMQAADITDADFAAEVRSVTARAPMRRTNSALALGGQADGGNRSAWAPQHPARRQQQLQEAAAAMLQQALLGLQGVQPAQPVVEILPRRKPGGLAGRVRDVMGRAALADASEAEMDARPVARPLAAALSGGAEPDTRSAEPPRAEVAAAHAGMQVDGSSRCASDNEQGRAAMDVVSQLRDRVLLKRPAGKAASKAAAKPKAAPKSKAAARPRPKAPVKPKAKPRPAAPARKKWQKTPPLALRQQFAGGCTSFRWAANCTPSCWRKRGY